MPITKNIGGQDLFGVVAAPINIHWLEPMVLVATSWNHTEKAFNTSVVTNRGATGTYQIIRFFGKDQAEEYIRKHRSELIDSLSYNDRENKRFRVLKSRGTSNYMQIPIVGWDSPVWVNSRKWSYVPDRQKDQAIEDAPEFFEEGATEQPISPTQKSTGFNFGSWKTIE